MTIVVDASVAMGWCFEDESTDATDAVLDRLDHDDAVVPMLWHLEVANVLLVAERRTRITQAQVTRFLDLLGQLPIASDPSPVDPGAVVAVGRLHDLSAYDAVYLALAERHGAPMATLDEKLRSACRAAGVPLLIES